MRIDPQSSNHSPSKDIQQNSNLQRRLVLRIHSSVPLSQEKAYSFVIESLWESVVVIDTFFRDFTLSQKPLVLKCTKQESPIQRFGLYAASQGNAIDLSIDFKDRNAAKTYLSKIYPSNPKTFEKELAELDDTRLYQNNLKNREYAKEAPRFLPKLAGAEAAKLKKFSAGVPEDASSSGWGAGGTKSGGCPTQAETDSSGCFGIRPFVVIKDLQKIQTLYDAFLRHNNIPSKIPPLINSIIKLPNED